jgi:hypothetical protein
VTAGYSGTPLAKKLGITAGGVIGTFAAPSEFADLLAPLPPAVEIVTDPDEPCDVLVLFVTSRADLEARVGVVLSRMPSDGACWVAWPKRSSGIATDVTEQTLRDVLLPRDVVDNKVAAISDTWSGLRFVVRREHRSAWPHGS